MHALPLPVLQAIREAHVVALDEAALQARRQATADVSMPKHLQAAAMWLADTGIRFDPCDGDLFFCWPPNTCRSYLNGLSAAARAEEVEAGRKVIFEGSRGYPALYPTSNAVFDTEYLDPATAQELRVLSRLAA